MIMDTYITQTSESECLIKRGKRVCLKKKLNCNDQEPITRKEEDNWGELFGDSDLIGRHKVLQ